MEIAELVVISVILYAMNASVRASLQGLQLQTNYAQLLLENQKVNVICKYTGPGSYNLTWRIFDPETKLEPYISHGRGDMVPKLKRNIPNLIEFEFVARRDIQNFNVECAAKEKKLTTLYRIPRIQKLSLKTPHCERAHIIMDRVNEMVCYIDKGADNENMTLIYKIGSDMKQLKVKYSGKIHSFEETLYYFEIHNVEKILNKTPYQCVINTLGSDGRNLTIYSKIKDFVVHYMEFLDVPSKSYGARNYSTVLKINITANPLPKASDFDIKYLDKRDGEVMRPTDLKMLSSNGSSKVIELYFKLNTSGNYSLGFKDVAQPRLQVTSQQIDIKLLEIHTSTASLNQQIEIDDQVNLILILEAVVNPNPQDLAFYRLKQPGETKDERIKERYVTFKTNAMAGVCKIEVALIPKKTGIYRFEIIVEKSRLIGPRFYFEVHQKEKPKTAYVDQFYLILLLGTLVPTLSLLLAFLTSLAVRKAWRVLQNTGSVGQIFE